MTNSVTHIAHSARQCYKNQGGSQFTSSLFTLRGFHFDVCRGLSFALVSLKSSTFFGTSSRLLSLLLPESTRVETCSQAVLHATSEQSIIYSRC